MASPKHPGTGRTRDTSKVTATKVPHVSIPAETLWVFAIVLALFGVAFAALGMSNERAYWSQRDPSGDPRKEATPFRTVFARAGHFATGEYRAPLRVAAIGVLMLYGAVIAAIIAILLGL